MLLKEIYYVAAEFDTTLAPPVISPDGKLVFLQNTISSSYEVKLYPVNFSIGKDYAANTGLIQQAYERRVLQQALFSPDSSQLVLIYQSTQIIEIYRIFSPLATRGASPPPNDN